MPHHALIADCIDELLDGVTDREVLVAADGKSGNTLERVTRDGETFVCKYMTVEGDWIMRVMGDDVFWPYLVWRSDLLERMPATIDHTMVAMALDDTGPVRTLAILMHDVGDHVLPEGDDPVAPEVHAGFLAHMAEMHAAYWGWTDTVGLQTMTQRLLPFEPAKIAAEHAAHPDAGVPGVAVQGWARLRERAPTLAAALEPLHADPAPLVDALAATPTTFVHGDWKMGNLGRHPDGRTILLDWAYLGQAPPLWDLAWYLAINRARIPESKDATIARYRHALTGHGIDTDPWFAEQWDLARLGMTLNFGWEKALGDAEELAWWEAGAVAGLSRLDRRRHAT